MYALSPGRGSFCRPAFSGSPCPPLAAARVGGRARSRAPGRSPGACPSAPGGRRSVSAQGVPAAGCARPCARSAAPPFASPLPSLRAGLRGAVGRPRAPSPWARARFGRGRRFPLAPPPTGVRALPLPRGGFRARLRRASLCARAPPRGLVWWCRRCGGGASAPFCFAAGESFGFFPSRSPRSERRSAPRFMSNQLSA